MSDTTTTNIQINVDATQALSQINALSKSIANFNKSVLTSSQAAVKAQFDFNKALAAGITATGQFNVSFGTAQSSVKTFSQSLEAGKLSFGEYVKYGVAASKRFSGAFKQESQVIDRLAQDRVKTLQTRYQALGKTVDGVTQVMKITPNELAPGLGTNLAVSTQKAQIFNKVLQEGTTHLQNWGKNTQWAGRQLMVGFTIPVVMFASKAMKAFGELEQQALRFRRVYGDMFTTPEDAEKALKDMKALSLEMTKYGVAVSETIRMSADAAAAGKKGAELRESVSQAIKLSVLGEVDQQQALRTTIALQNAYKINAKDLGGAINYLNAVENQSVLSIEDLTAAIPRLGPIIQQLGGDIKDTSVFLAAMKEAGISAEQGANALKSGLANIINPTQKAQDTLKGFGIDIKKIVADNEGNLMGMVTAVAEAMNTLSGLKKQQAMEELFGKFQFAKVGALLDNITQKGSQANQVLQLANTSAIELAALSQKELLAIETSPVTKLKKAFEELKMAIAPVGKVFMEAAVPMIQIVTRMAELFNGLPKPLKLLAAGLLIAVPVLTMLVGLGANFIATLLKMANSAREFAQKLLGGGKNTKYISTAQLEAIATTTSLEGKMHSLTKELLLQKNAYQNLIRIMSQYATQAGKIPATIPGGFVRGGTPPVKMARGGVVPGTGNEDSQPALLMPGEVVMNKRASRRFGPILNAMNAGTIGMFSAGKNTNEGNRSAQKAHTSSEVILNFDSVESQIEFINQLLETKITDSFRNLLELVKDLAQASGMVVGEFKKIGRLVIDVPARFNQRLRVDRSGVTREQAAGVVKDMGASAFYTSTRLLGKSIDDNRNELKALAVEVSKETKEFSSFDSKKMNDEYKKALKKYTSQLSENATEEEKVEAKIKARREAIEKSVTDEKDRDARLQKFDETVEKGRTKAGKLKTDKRRAASLDKALGKATSELDLIFDPQMTIIVQKSLKKLADTATGGAKELYDGLYGLSEDLQGYRVNLKKEQVKAANRAAKAKTGSEVVVVNESERSYQSRAEVERRKRAKISEQAPKTFASGTYELSFPSYPEEFFAKELQQLINKAAKHLSKGLGDGTKKALKSASPSKETKETGLKEGKNAADGLVQGLEEGMSGLRERVTKATRIVSGSRGQMKDEEISNWVSEFSRAGSARGTLPTTKFKYINIEDMILQRFSEGLTNEQVVNKVLRKARETGVEITRETAEALVEGIKQKAARPSPDQLDLFAYGEAANAPGQHALPGMSPEEMAATKAMTESATQAALANEKERQASTAAALADEKEKVASDAAANADRRQTAGAGGGGGTGTVAPPASEEDPEAFGKSKEDATGRFTSKVFAATAAFDGLAMAMSMFGGSIGKWGNKLFMLSNVVGSLTIAGASLAGVFKKIAATKIGTGIAARLGIPLRNPGAAAGGAAAAPLVSGGVAAVLGTGLIAVAGALFLANKYAAKSLDTFSQSLRNSTEAFKKNLESVNLLTSGINLLKSAGLAQKGSFSLDTEGTQFAGKSAEDLFKAFKIDTTSFSKSANILQDTAFTIFTAMQTMEMSTKDLDVFITQYAMQIAKAGKMSVGQAKAKLMTEVTAMYVGDVDALKEPITIDLLAKFKEDPALGLKSVVKQINDVNKEINKTSKATGIKAGNELDDMSKRAKDLNQKVKEFNKLYKDSIVKGASGQYEVNPSNYSDNAQALADAANKANQDLEKSQNNFTDALEGSAIAHAKNNQLLSVAIVMQQQLNSKLANNEITQAQYNEETALLAPAIQKATAAQVAYIKSMSPDQLDAYIEKQKELLKLQGFTEDQLEAINNAVDKVFDNKGKGRKFGGKHLGDWIDQSGFKNDMKLKQARQGLISALFAGDLSADEIGQFLSMVDNLSEAAKNAILRDPEAGINLAIKVKTDPTAMADLQALSLRLAGISEEVLSADQKDIVIDTMLKYPNMEEFLAHLPKGIREILENPNAPASVKEVLVKVTEYYTGPQGSPSSATTGSAPITDPAKYFNKENIGAVQEAYRKSYEDEIQNLENQIKANDKAAANRIARESGKIWSDAFAKSVKNMKLPGIGGGKVPGPMIEDLGKAFKITIPAATIKDASGAFVQIGGNVINATKTMDGLADATYNVGEILESLNEIEFGWDAKIKEADSNLEKLQANFDITKQKAEDLFKYGASNQAGIANTPGTNVAYLNMFKEVDREAALQGKVTKVEILPEVNWKKFPKYESIKSKIPNIPMNVVADFKSGKKDFADFQKMFTLPPEVLENANKYLGILRDARNGVPGGKEAWAALGDEIQADVEALEKFGESAQEIAKILEYNLTAKFNKIKEQLQNDWPAAVNALLSQSEYDVAVKVNLEPGIEAKGLDNKALSAKFEALKATLGPTFKGLGTSFADTAKAIEDAAEASSKAVEEAYKVKIKAVTDYWDGEIKKLEDSFAEWTKQTERDWDDATTQMERDWEDATEGIQKDFDKQREAAEEAYQGQRDAAEESYNAQRDALEKSFDTSGLEKEKEQRVQQINDAFDYQINALQEISKYEQFITEQKSQQVDLASAIAQGDIAAAAKAAGAMTQTQTEFAQGNVEETLNKGKEVALKQIEDEYDARKTAMESGKEAALKALEEQHKAAMKAMDDQHKTDMDNMQTSFDARMKKRSRDHDDAMKIRSRAHEDDMEKARIANDLKVKNLNDLKQAALDSLDAQKTKEIQDINDLKQLRKDKLDEFQRDVETSLNNREAYEKQKIQNVVDKINTDEVGAYKNVKTEVDAIGTEIDRQTTLISTSLQAALDAASSQWKQQKLDAAAQKADIEITKNNLNTITGLFQSSRNNVDNFSEKVQKAAAAVNSIIQQRIDSLNAFATATPGNALKMLTDIMGKNFPDLPQSWKDLINQATLIMATSQNQPTFVDANGQIKIGYGPSATTPAARATQSAFPTAGATLKTTTGDSMSRTPGSIGDRYIGSAAEISNDSNNMNPSFKSKLTRLLNDFPGVYVQSAARPSWLQAQLWEDKLKETGGDATEARKWIAPPGDSMHEHGLAADLTFSQGEGNQVKAAAASYGLKFPADNEPWHIEDSSTKDAIPTAAMMGDSMSTTNNDNNKIQVPGPGDIAKAAIFALYTGAWPDVKTWSKSITLDKTPPVGESNATIAAMASSMTKTFVSQFQADCADFVSAVLRAVGYTFPMSANAGQLVKNIKNLKEHTELSPSQSKPGDIIYWHGKKYGAVKDEDGFGYHVAIAGSGRSVYEGAGGAARFREVRGDFSSGSILRLGKPPGAANGAVVAPTPGGTPYIVGEGGQTEIISPVPLLLTTIQNGLRAFFTGGQWSTLLTEISKLFSNLNLPAVLPTTLFGSRPTAAARPTDLTQTYIDRLKALDDEKTTKLTTLNTQKQSDLDRIRGLKQAKQAELDNAKATNQSTQKIKDLQDELDKLNRVQATTLELYDLATIAINDDIVARKNSVIAEFNAAKAAGTLTTATTGNTGATTGNTSAVTGNTGATTGNTGAVNASTTSLETFNNSVTSISDSLDTLKDSSDNAYGSLDSLNESLSGENGVTAAIDGLGSSSSETSDLIAEAGGAASGFAASLATVQEALDAFGIKLGSINTSTNGATATNPNVNQGGQNPLPASSPNAPIDYTFTGAPIVNNNTPAGSPTSNPAETATTLGKHGRYSTRTGIYISGPFSGFDHIFADRFTSYDEYLSELTQGGLAAFPRTGGEYSTGGMIPEYYANGGGPKGTDTVPAWLTPGEFVIRKDVAQKYKHLLPEFNRTGKIPRYYATGGTVVVQIPGATPSGSTGPAAAASNPPVVAATVQVQPTNIDAVINSFIAKLNTAFTTFTTSIQTKFTGVITNLDSLITQLITKINSVFNNNTNATNTNTGAVANNTGAVSNATAANNANATATNAAAAANNTNAAANTTAAAAANNASAANNANATANNTAAAAVTAAGAAAGAFTVSVSDGVATITTATQRFNQIMSGPTPGLQQQAVPGGLSTAGNVLLPDGTIGPPGSQGVPLSEQNAARIYALGVNPDGTNFFGNDTLGLSASTAADITANALMGRIPVASQTFMGNSSNAPLNPNDYNGRTPVYDNAVEYGGVAAAVATGATGQIRTNAINPPANSVGTRPEDFFSTGGMVIAKYAMGGMVKPGYFARGGSTDTVPAMLTPGEYVVKASSAKRFGGLLDDINSGKKPRLDIPNIDSYKVSVNPDAVTTNTVNSPMYNINVSVASNANPDDIAFAVKRELRRENDRNIRGYRA